MKNVILTPGMTKSPKFDVFQKFLFFHEVFIFPIFMDWNVEKSQQGKTLLSSRLSGGKYAVYPNE